MFNKSLLFILLTILGGFFFSASAYSSDVWYRISVTYGGSYCKAGPESHLIEDRCSFAGLGDFTGSVDGRGSQCTSGDYMKMTEYPDCGSSNPPYPEPPFDGDGGCNFVPELVGTGDMCDYEADPDNDGVPNYADEDWRSYDPDYCSTTNPSSAVCSDDGGNDGGDDGSGGGNDGGGDSSGWEPPVGSECNYQSDSESCCYDFAQWECQDKGGIATWGYVSIGGQECNVTCNDWVDDGSDPGDDGGDGDDGSGDQTDNSDVVNAINQLKDSNITEFGQFKDALDSLVTQTSQQTDDLVAAQQNNTDTLSGDINTLNDTNQTGFDALTAQLEDIKNNTAQSSDGLTNELLEAIRDDTTGIFSSLGDLNQNQWETNRSLDELNDSVSTIGDALNTDEPVPDEGDFGSGDFGGEAAGNGIGDALSDRFGELPDGLPNEVIDLSEGADDFKPILQDTSSDCPDNPTIDLGVAEFSLNWVPICDLFGIIRILLIASATIAVPFIILGTSKK